jgi:glutathione-regulated potassium-efflux system ancillary protein KefG
VLIERIRNFLIVAFFVVISQMACAQKHILVVLAHPDMVQSEVNKSIVSEFNSLDRITIDDLYVKYPEFLINVEKEQKLLVEHDVIIFQFPLYWFSSPALLKKWQDDVITSAFSIGENNKLKGKKLMVVVSVGGTAGDYRHGGLMDVTMDEILAPFETFARLTEMEYVTPFVTYAVPNPKILNIPMSKEEKAQRSIMIEARVKDLVAVIKKL